MAKHVNLRIETVRAEYDGELKYAVVEDVTFLTPKTDERGKTVFNIVESKKKDKNGEPVRFEKLATVETTQRMAVEYQEGQKVLLAHFPRTKEGLAKAKEVLKALKTK